MGAIRFLSTCFIWFPCGLPIWVPDPANNFHRSCPQFRPWAPYSFCPPVSYGSHVGCQYSIWVACGSQILPTFSPDLANIFAFESPVRVLSARFIKVPRGLANRVPDPGEIEHCTHNLTCITYYNVVTSCVKQERKVIFGDYEI